MESGHQRYNYHPGTDYACVWTPSENIFPGLSLDIITAKLINRYCDRVRLYLVCFG